MIRFAQSLRLAAVLTFAISASTCFAQGISLPGVGPVNRSMGGAGVAAPLDATGAVHWNPASITGLKRSQVDIGVEFLNNRNTVESSIGPFGGSTDSLTGATALPAIGLVHKTDSALTYGLGINGIGGFSTNYPGSLTNPVFAPRAAGGLGSAYSRLTILQVAPTVAAQLTETVSVGIAPTVNVAELQLSPFPLQGATAAGFPNATNTRPFYGLGVQAGVFVETPDGVNVGLSVKSPQWFEKAEYNSNDPATGLPTTLDAQIQFPAIVSLGVAYTGWDNLVLAADTRWIGYDSTDLFGDSAGFTPEGNATGLGWRDVFALALGAELTVTQNLKLRAGYAFNESPVPDSAAFFNVLAPGVFQHSLTLGVGLQLTDQIVMNATWWRAFESEINGPIPSPPAPAMVPTNVRVAQTVDSALFGITVLY